jgi:proteasome accessory factor B
MLDMNETPFTSDLVIALNKIGFAAGDWDMGAISPLRMSSKFSYHSLWRNEKNTRKVDPYGLVCRHGTWFLVGYCHLRDAIRVFHLDRIGDLEVNKLKPKVTDFPFPDGFNLSDHVAKYPWALPVHKPVEAVIKFEAPIAEYVVLELSQAIDKVEAQGTARIISMQVTSLDGLLPTILSYRDKAMVLSPPELVEKTKDSLSRIATGE